MMVEMVSRHLLSPALLSLGSGRILSWWIGCFCLFAILWFRVLWASASVVEVAAIPTLRWLLTLGLISLIFFVLFIAILSRLSLARRAPAESWSVTPDTYSVSLVYLALLHPGCQHLHHFSLHRGVGILWSTRIGSPHVVRWEPSPVIGPALLSLAFRSAF